MSRSRVFFNVSIALLSAFLIAKFLLLYSVTLGLVGIIITAFIMFLISVFFLSAAKRTIHREKEVIFCTVSAVLLYCSVFEALNIMGTLILSPLVFIFVLFLFAYFLFEVREFYEKFINFSMILLIFLSLVQNATISNFASSSLIVGGVLIAIIAYYIGTNIQSFDKKSYFSFLVGWAILLSIERAIFMLWSIQ